ncbi:acyl-CoA/acyl-ACP dehydrogenase [Actinoallomurus purpureus]|uniref:acyl-CoA dehydrogenase family protein n=1 Tax=Actinoallomurus purpureus TaxID=478114 RepID=UPI002093B372|nr:acyl-CoA dehydrogenase family protein [Actinoallomurus purpureus]MCO6006375.1 acyl-CoA/acyl-ACP dehydrogenase [Actinoallomurus purpureus]
MDFAFSEEQEQLRGFARDFLAERYDDVRLAQIADSETGVDAEVWAKLAEMGWLDAELTFLDQAVLLEETGYRPLAAPYFSTAVLAAPALDDETAKQVGEGRLTATLAWAEPGVPQGLLDAAGATVSGGRLTGEKVLVPDGAAVDLFVVTTADGLYAVDASDAAVTPHGALDGTRRPASVRFDGAPARPLASGDTAAELLGRIRDRAYAAVALEAVGVAQRALDLLVAYAKDRKQFGKPIGVYQAVSHKASDVYVRLQEARSLAYWAAWCVAENDPMARQACLAAKAFAGEAAVFACENAIQGHGGIGFTWEHVLHRYYKRAQWLAAFDGPARAQRAEVAAFLMD